MQSIDELRAELEAATQAAHAAPRGVNEWPAVNKLRAELDAAIEAAKTPEQRKIEELQVEVDRLQRREYAARAALGDAMRANSDLRNLIGLHTGKPSDKPNGLLAMDLALIRTNEDLLAEAVRAGDLQRAQRICINRGLPRPNPKTLIEDLQQIGLIHKEKDA